MSQGNQGVAFWYMFHGNPVGLAHAIFNAPENSIVIDTLNNVIRMKTSPRGDNSGYLTIANLNAPLVLKDTVNGNLYSLTSSAGMTRLVQLSTPVVPPGVTLEPGAQLTDTVTNLPVALYIDGGELKVGALPTPASAVPILTDPASGTQYQITSAAGEIRLVPTTPP
jgi:hypothetical protein